LPASVFWILLNILFDHQERKAERKRQRSLLSERYKYGKTPGGKKYVDMEILEQLCQLGYGAGSHMGPTVGHDQPAHSTG